MDYCHFNMEKCYHLFILSIFCSCFVNYPSFFPVFLCFFIFFHNFHYFRVCFEIILFLYGKANIFTCLFLYIFTNSKHVQMSFDEKIVFPFLT